MCLKNEVIGHLALIERHISTLTFIQCQCPFNSFVLSPLTLLHQILHEVSHIVVSRVLSLEDQRSFPV